MRKLLVLILLGCVGIAMLPTSAYANAGKHHHHHHHKHHKPA